MKFRSFLFFATILMLFSSIFFSAESDGKEYKDTVEILIYKSTPRLVRILELLGGKILESYPEYCIASVPSSVLSVLNGTCRYIILENLDYVLVQNFPFSYKHGQRVPTELMNKDTKLLIVKFKYFPKLEWLKEIERYGKIIGYINHNSVLIKADRDILPNRDYICFVGKYYVAYKIDPEIFLNKSIEKVKIVLLKDSSINTYTKLKKEGINCTYVRGLYFDYLYGEIPYSVILNIGKLDSVIYIQKDYKFKILNDLARGIVQAGTLSAVQPIWDRGIRGDGQIVGEADTGIDYDHAMFRDSRPPKFDDPKNYDINNLPPPDLTHRKIVHYWTFVDNYDLAYSGHGTHVAGSIAGNATPYSSYAAPYNGQAPSAKISFVDIGGAGDSLSLPVDLNYLFYWHYSDGARISSNSWGAKINRYTIESMQVDQFIWNYPDFVILFSNGNSGPSASTVGSPATAKNCISVGALGRSGLFSSQTLNDIASFSSRGPTADNRLKPTIVTSGVRIDSADSDGNPNSNNAGITVMDGTSMAAPHAAGAVALTRQYFMDGYYPAGGRGGKSFIPSAALLIAMLVNSADQATGSGSSSTPYNGMNFPNCDQGFGRINLDRAMYFDGDSRKLVVYDYGLSKVGLWSGEAWETQIRVSSSSEPLKVTLAWMDYPALPGTSKALLNDLDLIVISPTGTYYHGNVFSGNVGSATSAPNPTTYDRNNNIEEVWIQNPTTGIWTIRVLCYSSFVSQPFALVVTGAIDSSRSIMFDKSLYGREKAKLYVVDLSASANVTVRIRSDSDPTGKMITLYSVGRGIFEGTINISSDIVVNDGEKIYAEYDGLTTYASVDLISPLIEDLVVKSLDTSAVIVWKTSEPTNYTFRYGSSPLSLQFKISESPHKKSHKILLYNLVPNSTYYFSVEVWDRVGNRRESGVLSFTTQPLADILVVDDSYLDQWIDYWKESLDALGWRYSVWYYSLQGRPSLSELNKYKALIWDTADGYPPLTDEDVNLLQQYISGGGKIVLVGQDIGWSAFDSNSPWYSTNIQNFLKNYMKINYVSDQVGNPPLEIKGVTGDPIGDGLTDTLVDTLGSFYPEEISNYGGIVSINYNTVPTKPAVVRHSSSYMSVYVAFAFQDIKTQTARNIFVDRSIRWLLGNRPTVTVRYPNGGEVLQGVVNITWEAVDDNTIAKCDVFISNDGGRSWSYLGSTNGNTLILDTTRLANGDSYKIRVIAYDNVGLSHLDESDSTFSIRNILRENIRVDIMIIVIFIAFIFSRIAISKNENIKY